ncbi:unnamed protein product [Oreochromis niloticus]|nr:unnamed protein product [Mustela putorius furo]
MPPPEQAHVAFQSPLLEYSSALGLAGGGLPPNSQPANPVTSMDIPRPSNETATGPSQASMFPSERSRSARERILSYRDALKQQEQQEWRRQEREDRERYEAQLEADMKNHQPWERGGGGAPLRDSTGNLIADLSQMHKLNEEAYSNPEQRQRRATAAAAEHLDPNERVSGFTHVQTPQFARGKVFASQPTEQQLQEQDKYKAYLKQQIEEKMRKRAEEREQIRLEEEKEEKRLAEQRARIQREYKEEQERKKRKEMERAVVDVFDMARLRLQAPIRRPNSRYTEPRNLLRVHDSLQLKYRDEESRLDSSEDPKLVEVGGTSRRRRDYRDSYHQLSSQRSTVQDDYFDLSPPQQNDLLRSETRGSARGSLLESESTFIALLDLSDDDDSPPQFSLHNRQGSIETDRWIRPETSDMLKCLDRAIRRERLAT